MSLLHQAKFYKFVIIAWGNAFIMEIILAHANCGLLDVSIACTLCSICIATHEHLQEKHEHWHDSKENQPCAVVCIVTYFSNLVMFRRPRNIFVVSEIAQLVYFFFMLKQRSNYPLCWIPHWQWPRVQGTRGASQYKDVVLPGMVIPMLKIRRPNGRLIFNMEIAIRR